MGRHTRKNQKLEVLQDITYVVGNPKKTLWQQMELK